MASPLLATGIYVHWILHFLKLVSIIFTCLLLFSGCFIRYIHNKLLSYIGQPPKSLIDGAGGSTGAGIASVDSGKSNMANVGSSNSSGLGIVQLPNSDGSGAPNSDIEWLASLGIYIDDLASLVVKHRNGSTTYLYDLGKSSSMCAVLYFIMKSCMKHL